MTLQSAFLTKRFSTILTFVQSQFFVNTINVNLKMVAGKKGLFANIANKWFNVQMNSFQVAFEDFLLMQMSSYKSYSFDRECL